MKILLDDQTLMSAVPNSICRGIGERSLFDRIAAFIDAAEAWFNSFFAPVDMIADLPEDSPVIHAARKLIAFRALRLAAPALDVTMHPNGLAVVSTDALAPASADRSREFRKSLDRMILESADLFISLAPSVNGWKESDPAQSLWLSHPFNSVAMMLTFIPVNPDWETFHAAAQKVISITHRLAEDVVSPEIMKKLCNFYSKLDYDIAHLHRFVRSYIAEEWNRDHGGDPWIPRIVETLKNYFPEWNDSRQARLFDPPVFRNQKKSGGYFF